MSETTLLTYDQVIEQTGFSRRTLNDRILSEQIVTYVDGVDRRRRLIAAKDVPRLVEVRPAQRREEVAA